MPRAFLVPIFHSSCPLPWDSIIVNERIPEPAEIEAQKSTYNLPKASRKGHRSLVLIAVGRNREDLLTPHLYPAVFILSVDVDGRPPLCTKIQGQNGWEYLAFNPMPL